MRARRRARGCRGTGCSSRAARADCALRGSKTAPPARRPGRSRTEVARSFQVEEVRVESRPPHGEKQLLARMRRAFRTLGGEGLLSQILQLLVAGVSQGCVYALVALGFVLIYKATETVNFAQGDVMMLGAFFALTASVIMGWPYWATIVFAVAVMAVVGMLTERLVLRPVLGHPSFTVVMITIGVGYVMRGVVTMVPGWGTETHQIPTPGSDIV